MNVIIVILDWCLLSVYYFPANSATKIRSPVPPINETAENEMIDPGEIDILRSILFCMFLYNDSFDCLCHLQNRKEKMQPCDDIKSFLIKEIITPLIR